MEERKWIDEFYSYGALIPYTPEQSELLNKNAPVMLYQYRSGSEYDLNNIRNGVIWASAVERFNDPFDCDFNMKLMKEWGNEILKKYPGSLMKYNLVAMEKAMLNMREDTAVSCFSEEKESILMWSHYANKHKGICVCYDPLEVLAIGKCLFPVWYKTEKVNPYIRNGKEGIKLNDRIKEIFVQKAPEWGYEKEWRIIQMTMSEVAQQKLKKDGGLEIGVIYPKCIILGARAEEELVEKVKKLGEEKMINIAQMKLCENEYRLEIAHWDGKEFIII